MLPKTDRFYEFNEFRLDIGERVLLCKNQPQHITPKVFHLLKFLIENRGRVVEKQELMQEIWAESFVEEGNLTFTVRQLRKALGDDARQSTFVETVPRRGYRFIAVIREIEDCSKENTETEKKEFIPPPKPYILLTTAIISLISLFGIAFVWINGEVRPATSPTATAPRLTNHEKVTVAAIAPDGLNLVYARKEGIGESLWRRQIKTGDQAQILPPQAVEFIGLAVSPDNNFVYYSVFSANSAVQLVSRVLLSGGSPEVLPDIDSDVSVGFSPDGKKFAYTESFNSLDETHLKTADADGSNQKTLVKTKGDQRMFEVFKASPVAWSPDGETIACAVRERDDNGWFYKILLVNPNDGSEKYLSEKHWNFVEHVAWIDNEHLAAIDSEPNLPISHVWKISRKTGEASRLTDDSNDYQWLSSAGGKLFTVEKKVFSSLHVADFMENTATVQSKQIHGEAGLIDNVVWSNDGKLYYNSRASGKNEIWQISTEGAAARQLTTDSNLNFSFAVSPIDNTIVFSAAQNGKTSLFTADSNGKSIRQLTDGVQDFLPSFSSDGKTVVFQRTASRPTLWQVDVFGNQPPVQLTGYHSTHPSISPDSPKIAYHFIDYGSKNPHWKLGIVNSENRNLLNKLEFPIPVSERQTTWRPRTDSLTLIFQNGENAGIILLSATDGKFQIIDNLAVNKISSVGWSTDGSRFAFSQVHETTDVVEINGF